ncbi:hypothetical protein L3067_14510 [Xanthomonas sp. PPL568]|uniref:hypothetical protein n=1 Tax=Xanthomonas indica TaxID=2912242 RepID=UPI001F59CF37|nr:hypothetical protein [Xanthomonas indica]MCI2245817.1 hypothetical protein [Xanthomonas indica]
MTGPVQAQDGRLPPRAQWHAACSSHAPLGAATTPFAPRQRGATRRSDRYRAGRLTLSTPFRTLEARW